MNVVVIIEDREAIPVRAIRFALHRKHDSSSELASIGNPDSSIPIKRFAYYWKRGEIKEASLAYWKKLSFERSRLPAGVWMWLDEFEEAFNWVLCRVPPPIGLQLGPGGFSFDYNPPMSTEEWADAMEEFERFLQSSPSELPSPAGIPVAVTAGTGQVEPLPAPATDSPAPAAKKLRKPTKMERLRPRLQEIVDALERYAQETNQTFDRHNMPGPRGEIWTDEGSFIWLCGKLEPEFRMPYGTFEKYCRGGVCACKQFAKPTDFYVKALPKCRQFLEKQ